MIKKKNLLNYCGLLGVAAFLSYTAAVVCSNCSWYDDGRRNWNEYCTEGLFRDC